MKTKEIGEFLKFTEYEINKFPSELKITQIKKYIVVILHQIHLRVRIDESRSNMLINHQAFFHNLFLNLFFKIKNNQPIDYSASMRIRIGGLFSSLDDFIDSYNDFIGTTAEKELISVFRDLKKMYVQFFFYENKNVHVDTAYVKRVEDYVHKYMRNIFFEMFNFNKYK